jgi:hypothetical protein
MSDDVQGISGPWDLPWGIHRALPTCLTFVRRAQVVMAEQRTGTTMGLGSTYIGSLLFSFAMLSSLPPRLPAIPPADQRLLPEHLIT